MGSDCLIELICNSEESWGIIEIEVGEADRLVCLVCFVPHSVVRMVVGWT